MDEVSRALPRGEYGDPLAVLMRRECRTCAGCVWVAEAFDVRYCSKGKRFGKRCQDYSEVLHGA